MTDASLVLGYLDPDYFAGGAFRLDAGAARRAIAERIAARSASPWRPRQWACTASSTPGWRRASAWSRSAGPRSAPVCAGGARRRRPSACRCAATGRLYRDFVAAHARVYGHATEGPATIVSLRSIHRVAGHDDAACVDAEPAASEQGGRPIAFTHRGERHYCPARGFAGGGDGATARSRIVRADGTEEIVPSKIVTTLHTGDRLVLEERGGGGWGPSGGFATRGCRHPGGTAR